MIDAGGVRALVRRALEALGVRRLLLAIHDAALPADAADDLGHGALLSRGGLAFLRHVAQLGFDGVQLGPQGITSAHDPSPYDSTLFARNLLSLSPQPLLDLRLVAPESVQRAARKRPAAAALRTDHAYAQVATGRLLEEAFARHSDSSDAELSYRLAEFQRQEREWLEPAALFHALSAEHGTPDVARWPALDQRLWAGDAAQADAAARRRDELFFAHGTTLERFALGQLFAHEQHAEACREAARLGLRLYGDLHVGMAPADEWAFAAHMLPGYRLGAPPSRTNPEGQPWNYAVLHPDAIGPPGAPGPAARLLRRRADKLLAEFAGVRLDHPHGLIDPWVYRADKADAHAAVQGGARLRSSPDLSDHPALSPWSIAEPSQLDRDVMRFADGWVTALREEQVDRYGALFAQLLEAARARPGAELFAEVLSTQPYPVRRVLDRAGLGRFRVTQKVDLSDPRDVYRSENAAPTDVIQCGNHDTDPIWRVAGRWTAEDMAEEHATYLADRLVPDASARARWVAAVSSTPERLALAKLAELFTSPAQNVLIHFGDLLGLREPYNVPGTVSNLNWTLRVPPDFRERHAQDAAAGRALDLPRALAMALRARGPHTASLAEELERVAGPDPAA